MTKNIALDGRKDVRPSLMLTHSCVKLMELEIVAGLTRRLTSSFKLVTSRDEYLGNLSSSTTCPDIMVHAGRHEQLRVMTPKTETLQACHYETNIL